MTKKPKARISTFGSQLTSVVSVTLVLLILGILAVALQASSSVTDNIRRNIGFIVKLDRSLSDTDISRIGREMSAAQFAESVTFTDAATILKQESELMGQNILELTGENPFGAEFDVKVKPLYANGDSIAAITARMEMVPVIDEVVSQTAVVDSINVALKRTTIVLLAIAIALGIISFVLINNTVSLAVYSRRFIIHTMKLVGATGSFIRKPFLIAGLGTGAVSGILACALLAGLRAYGARFDAILDSLVPWASMWWIFAAVIVIGILICLCATALATNRYLRRSYDDMFMK